MLGRRPERLFDRYRRRGDVGALGAVFDALAPEVLGVAMHLARDPVQAEDLLQRTFLTAIERAATFDTTQRLVPWLLGILANHAREAARSERRTPDPQRLKPEAALDPVEAAERRETLSDLERALEGLPDPCRSVVVLRFRHGMEPAEIAHALSLPAATVRSHIHRGIERLRKSAGHARLAGVLAGYPTLRGLASVRGTVLRHAAEAAPSLVTSGAAAAVLVGGLMVKKSLLTVSALLVLLGGGTAVWTALHGPERDAVREADPLQSDAGSEALPASAALEGSGTRRHAAAPAKPAARPGFGSIVTLVRWPDASPAQGVALLMLVGGDPNSGEARRTATDVAGRAAFEDVPAGKTLVRTDRGRGKSVDVPSGGQVDVVLELPEGVRVEGEVVDAAQRAVAGAEVWLCSDVPRFLAVPATRTDSQGRFVLPHVTFAEIWARADGHAPSPAQRVRGTKGQVDRVRLVLGGPEALVEGRVVDPEGQPVGGARIQLGGNHMGQGKKLADGTQGDLGTPVLLFSDAAGRFQARGLTAGNALVGVRAPGRGSLKMWLKLEPAPEPNRTELRLPGLTVIEGTVRGEDGRALASAWVQIEEHQLFLSFSTQADAEGRYRLEGVPEAQKGIQVEARAEGHAAAGAGLTVAAGTPTRWDPVLKRAPVLRLRVLDEEGRPVPSLSLQAWVGGYMRYGGQGRTDAEGRVRIELSADDEYDIRAFDGFEGASHLPFTYLRRVRPGEREIEWRIALADRSSARFRGTVEVPEGALPTGTQAYAMSSRSNEGTYLPIDQSTGRLESPLLPPGRYEVFVSLPNYGQVKFGEYRLARDQIIDLGRLVVRAPGSLSVRVVRPAGVTGWQTARAESARSMDWIQDFSPDGVGRLPKAQPGTYRITVTSPQDKSIGTATAVVEEGKDTEVTVTLSPAREVKLRFVLPTAKSGLDGLRVKIRSEGDDLVLLELAFTAWSATPLESTAWLLPGRYRAVASWEDGASDVPFEVADDAGPGTPIPVTLTR